MKPARWVRAALVAFGGGLAMAQQGDRQNDPQAPLPADLVVPPAVVRSPAEALGTFRIQPGFRIELAAAEPLVGDPVVATFDPAGRLWVVEMRGFMPDVDAHGEREPVGLVAVLHDDDGDGRFDRRSVFLERLVLPRAVLPLRGGALVLEPPDLWWCPDRDGDLVADGKQRVLGGFEAGLENPEHSGNGLLWGLDQHIHLANDKRVLRWTPSGFTTATWAGGGQWGITQDDRGRFYFNYNEDWLRCDLVPGRYVTLPAADGPLPGHNHRLLQDTSVFPIRITPGVNRGYQKGRLVDHVLAIHTAVCGPHVYRGDRLGDADGDAFVCEPAGHVVRRIRFADGDARMTGANVRAAERAEFLASTDERFRPVHATSGPDGALYVVDMYRGVIQHKNFVTTFLRRQIEARGLAAPIGLGRIWRIVPEDAAVRPRPPSLDGAPVAALVAALGEANGVRRDLAMRELVQRGERGAAPALRMALRDHARPGCRIGLLGVLSGLGVLDATDLRHALHDQDPGVVGFALQHAAAALQAGDGLLWVQLTNRLPGLPPNGRWQAALLAGEVLAGRPPSPVAARAVALLQALAPFAAADGWLARHLAVAAGDRAEALAGQLGEAVPTLQTELARVAVASRAAGRQAAIFDLAQSRGPESRRALLRGAVAALPKGPARVGWLRFPTAPPALVALANEADERVGAVARELLAAVAVAAPPPAKTVADLPPTEAARYRDGAALFARACAACHQPDGGGQQGLAPPLRGSEWVAGPAERLGRIVLHGVRGPLEVAGTTWNLEMPAQAHLGDAELAAILTYVRVAFGGGDTVAASAVTAWRAQFAARREPWTAAELGEVR